MKNIILGILLISFVQAVNASVTWDWSFPEPNVFLSPKESFFLGGTVTNDISSTDNININAGIWDVSGDLIFTDFEGVLYTTNEAYSEVGGLLENISGPIIAPGVNRVN